MATVAIYKATNILNGKMYIGQSIHPERRFTEHRRGSKSKILSAAIKKHGKENFEFKILCWCPDKTYADMVEVKLIEAHDTRRVGYNICVGGEGLGSGADHPKFGKKAAEETRRRIAAAKVGELNPNYGKPNSPEQKAKIRESLLGRVIAWGDKISAAKKNKKSIVLCRNNTEVRIESITKAATFIGVQQCNLKKALDRKNNVCKGWTVSYGD